MSRGISWRQRCLLRGLLRAEQAQPAHCKGDPIAWRNLDYGPTEHEEDWDHFDSPECQWNIEQATRRALRSLEKRGLVRLGTRSFRPGEHDNDWTCQDRGNHVSGQSRYMTRVLLTDRGRRAALLAD
jgi:hypothetical protein